jgi:K+-transporting ATPase c subunit
LLSGLLLLLLGMLLLLRLLLPGSTHVVCQSLLKHQAGGEFT